MSEHQTPEPARPGHRVRHDGWTVERQRAFLDALAKCGNVRDACRAVKLSNTSAYRLRALDPAFGAAWDAALKRAATSLEQVAFARAVDGVEEVTMRDGQVVASRRRYSDGLLKLLLQASDPDKYGRIGNPSVKAREEVEARVREIEEATYNRAWRALAAEYRYHCEPPAVRLFLLAKLKAMHLRMCENPWCAECHPERGQEESPHPLGHQPPRPHRPLDPVEQWLEDAAILAARRAGVEPWIEPPFMPDVSWDPTRVPAPPPLPEPPLPPLPSRAG